MTETTLVLLILAGVVALQVFATFRLIRSKSYASDQKTAQMKLIWLLPFLGAAMVLAVLSQDGELGRRKDDTSRGDGGQFGG